MDGQAEKEKAYEHWLLQAAGTGSRGFLRLLRKERSARQIYEEVQAGTLKEKLPERYQKKAEKLERFYPDYDIEAAYKRLLPRGIKLVVEGEGEYPERLQKIPDPPYGLYYAGKLPDKEKRAVAIVGARECSEYGRYMAKWFSTALAQAGIAVISGMARGIDGISQQAALQVGGYSLAVFGCGVDVCYPAEHRNLYDSLIEKGGVCSEYLPGTEPRAMLFPPRNRIISGLADVILVIEAREKSGTLITVDMALEQGKEVYALPGRATDPLSRGCNRLIKQGAGLVETPEELIGNLWGSLSNTEKKGKNWTQQELVFLEGIQQRLWALLDFAPQSVEQLQQQYAKVYGEWLEITTLFYELLQICGKGYGKQVGGSYFAKKGGE